MTGLADKIIGHYEKHATAWDALRQSCPWNDKIWHDRFVDGLQQGAHVLDLGCGPGCPIAQHMIDRGLRFDGVLAWDSFFHLDHAAQRQMFAVFDSHASAGALLMFNTGPEHGEAIGEFGGDPLYHAS